MSTNTSTYEPKRRERAAKIGPPAVGAGLAVAGMCGGGACPGGAGVAPCASNVASVCLSFA
jgi:hypothetical protein